MRFLRIPTEQTDERMPVSGELPAWIIDGLPAETPRLEAPRLELPLPMPEMADEPPREEASRSSVIIIDL